jgi:adenylate cyclase
LKRHREVVFNPVVAQHNGRIVKLIGDGTLVEFGSVVDAVNCAIAIQRAA